MTALSMRETAKEIGHAYRTFRREWTVLVFAHDFPLPFLPYKWDSEAVAAWKAERTRRPANDVPPPRVRAGPGCADADALRRARRG